MDYQMILGSPAVVKEVEEGILGRSPCARALRAYVAQKSHRGTRQSGACATASIATMRPIDLPRIDAYAAPAATVACVPARIRSAARSAIMITGALVLPRVTDGITEASTTRRPSKP